MGFFAVSLTSASLVYGVSIGLNRAIRLAPALRLALVLTFLLTVPVAYTLASMPGHLVGAPVTGAALPVVGWSREVGDLRAPHFLATHAIQVVPLAGWLAAGALPRRAASAAVWAAAALWPPWWRRASSEPWPERR